jgi:hypothetical protein
MGTRRHFDLSRSSVMVVSNIETGAGSVAVSARRVVVRRQGRGGTMLNLVRSLVRAM